MPVVASTPDGLAFREAQALAEKLYHEGATKNNIDAVAKAGVHGLGDAGQVENTGVAGAIARGATEVVVFLCNHTPENLTQLFQGECNLAPSAFALSHTLFGDNNLPLFKYPQPQEVLDAYNSEDAGTKDALFKSMNVAGSKLLKGLKVGSVTCTTTDAKWFGISAGQSVKLHVVSAECDVGLFLEDYYRYSELVQEIVNCVMDEQNESI